MDTYLIPPHGQETHHVIQHLEGKSPSRQKAVSEWGEILCESCDAVIASEGDMLRVSDKCWKCATPMIAFEPILAHPSPQDQTSGGQDMIRHEQAPLFSADRLRVVGTLLTALDTPEKYLQRWAVEAYVHRCASAGFCKSSDQVLLCAQRFLAGKRKITPPGTARRKRELKERTKLLANLPPELLLAVDAAITDGAKAVEQYRQGIEKALNALVGSVMKRYKADPAVVKELLVRKLS